MPKVTGEAELSAFLRNLPAKLEQKVLRGGIRAGGEVIAEDARQNARSKRIEIKVRVKSEPGLITARIVVTKGGYLAWWQEHGIAAHLIAVRDERDRAGRTIKRLNTLEREGSLRIGGQFVGPVVRHPGVEKKAFMRPALDRRQQDALEAVARYVRERFTKAALAGPAPADDGDEA